MIGFVFQNPGMLPLALVAAPLWWLLAYARKCRMAVLEAMGGGIPTHRMRRDFLRVAAFVLLVLALARPGYSPRMEPSSRSGRDVVFALDVSRSMLAEDATPSRLEVSKQALRDALKAMSTERVGLVVYAGSASVLCPLTYDYDFVRYMLEQAQPRTVDFGGTTLQSAVEKCVDQVFMADREGMQDLVVMTDGGDHGSKIEKMVELLDEHQVDLLLLGVGDEKNGAPIPVEDEEGNKVLLEEDGATIFTRLDDAALRDFASQTARVNYLAVGTRPFDLGTLYKDFAAARAHESVDSGSGIRVYREAAVFFLIPALLLLILGEASGSFGWIGLRRGKAAVAVLCGLLLWTPSVAEAAGKEFITSFEEAVKVMESGKYEEAGERFSDLFAKTEAGVASAAELAAAEFNRGLCLLKLAEGETSTAASLAIAHRAQLAFLSAKRGDPGLDRASLRLEMTASMMDGLQQKLAEEEAAQEEMENALQQLIERIQALLESQQNLDNKVHEADGNPAAETQPGEFKTTQSEILDETTEIIGEMNQLDEAMKIPIPNMPAVESVMTEPLVLMKEAGSEEQLSIDNLVNVSNWPAARAHGLLAERRIRAVLDLLANNNSQDGESDEDGEEMEDEGEDYEMEESDQGTPDSMTMEGDLAADSEMQELPVPNYSAEDILAEEQGSMQFRQQKRGKASSAKVERDY
ncbi:VWA domain-containing protein [Luteolibacter algae]|uniref:VWA domain-containing protein n=1 Tax=Luteolibacter algae TaxID=454151 RepID=A0ABW5D5J9_9BACT